jgi:hypothetical protein
MAEQQNNAERVDDKEVASKVLKRSFIDYIVALGILLIVSGFTKFLGIGQSLAGIVYLVEGYFLYRRAGRYLVGRRGLLQPRRPSLGRKIGRAIKYILLWVIGIPVNMVLVIISYFVFPD